ncbi:MAG: PQQ-binding-like beta-propeller repeat protein, partial [Isosphaeraceae bacterium]
FFYLFSARATRPGQEEVLSSPLVIGLIGTLITLVLLGSGLYAIIQRTAASRLYNQAVADLTDGNHQESLNRFDEFLRVNPKDRRAPQARVHRAMANVRQYTESTGPSWSLALEAAREMFEALSETNEFVDARSELDQEVIKTGEALADRAGVTADRRILEEAESALALHGRVAGDAAEQILGRSRFPAKLSAARAAVLKSETRLRAMAAMDAALDEGSAARVYGARDALVALYADLAHDRELISKMGAANDLIRKAVTFDPSQRPAETEPRIDPLGPATRFVLRSDEGGDFSSSPPDGPMVFALSDGYAIGLDGATGAPRWQMPTGLASPFPPQAIPGGTSVVGFDARHAELVRLDGRTGALIWRQEIGESVITPPLVLGNQLLQPTPSGKLLAIDLESGALQGALDLGLPLAATPVSDESGKILYLAARADCLFLVARDPMACLDVIYLGHAAGSIVAPPTRVGRYLILAENARLDEGVLRVFLLDEDGTHPVEVQEVPVEGWCWSPPVASGSVLWFSGDRGGLSAHALGAYGQKTPLRSIARLNPDSRPTGPVYLAARSEREIWVGASRPSAYELDVERGRIATLWSLGEAGPATSPPQQAGALLVFTQRNQEGPGVVLSGADSRSGSVRWRTFLGMAWPSRLTEDGERLSTITPGGDALVLTERSLGEGGFVVAKRPRPGTARLPAVASELIEGTGWSAVPPALGASQLLVRLSADSEFREVRLPSAVGGNLLAWGAEIFLPGADGRAYLVDPTTGEPRAEPFVPPFDRDRPTRWRGAARLGQDAVILADDSGFARRLVRLQDPRPRLATTAELAIGKGLVAGPVTTRDAVVVVTEENEVRALAGRDLSPVGAWSLPSSPAFEPRETGGLVVVADQSGGLLTLGPDGRRLWSATTGDGAPLAGPPVVRPDEVVTVTRDGLLTRRDTRDGSAIESLPLGVTPSGGPIAVGQTLAIPDGPGTLRPWSPRPSEPVTSP